MKTSDLLKAENMNKNYRRNSDGRLCFIGEDGTLYTDGGNYPGGLNVNDDWELAREPVDFMTAINSGKRIKPNSISSDFMSVSYWLNTTALPLEIINRKWLIE